MKVSVFSQADEFIGKFDIDRLDYIEPAFKQFASSVKIEPYSYVKCSDRTWTLVPGNSGLELQESGVADATSAPTSEYQPVEQSALVLVLSIIAILKLIAAPIAGVLIGQESALLGLMFFLGGLVSGLILLGFAKMIGHLYECAQRLRHIDGFLHRSRNDAHRVAQ